MPRRVDASSRAGRCRRGAKICQIVPTTFHGISSGRAMTTRQSGDRPAARGIDSATTMPSGISMARMIAENSRLRHSESKKRPPSSRRRIEQLLEPADAVPEELVVAECVLDRIVDHRHQRQHRREGHDDEDRQDQQPGAVVERSCPSRRLAVDRTCRRRRCGCARGSKVRRGCVALGDGCPRARLRRDACDRRARRGRCACGRDRRCARPAPAAPAPAGRRRTNSGRTPSSIRSPAGSVG